MRLKLTKPNKLNRISEKKNTYNIEKGKRKKCVRKPKEENNKKKEKNHKNFRKNYQLSRSSYLLSF